MTRMGQAADLASDLAPRMQQGVSNFQANPEAAFGQALGTGGGNTLAGGGTTVNQYIQGSVFTQKQLIDSISVGQADKVRLTS